MKTRSMLHTLLVAGACAVAMSSMARAVPVAEPDTPTIFGPGVISTAAHESAPAFAPDGRTVYFGRSISEASIILVSSKTAHGWREPRIAPFSGRWLDMEPAMAPDGSYLVFVSNRPIAPGGPPLDGAMPGPPQPGKGANLWRVDRTARGWNAPVRLPDIVNASTSTYAPSIAANGDLYFMRPDGEKSRFRLFVAKRTAAGYEAPEPLSFSDGSQTDVDPAVAPDQSFLIFGSSRHPKTDIDLFIVHRTGTTWGDPVYLGDGINTPGSDAEPRLGPDHHTLYYSSERLVAPDHQPMSPAEGRRTLRAMTRWNNGLYNIWSVDVSRWIDRSAVGG